MLTFLQQNNDKNETKSIFETIFDFNEKQCEVLFLTINNQKPAIIKKNGSLLNMNKSFKKNHGPFGPRNGSVIFLLFFFEK